ncbi:AI-2E family transporter [uncultured Methanoregula sp.]|uniref:AI-2E family transporter n=1 Tax=uncultured Methanoregula sp. TaxID=1005933 RepID=UPI002AAA9818|nr:AI-2E family transporter [uncultured Methanoregula sp.]
MKTIRPEYYLFILLVLLSLAAIIVFWSVMDMVLLGASLAIVLYPVYKKLSARIRPVFASVILTAIVLVGSCAAVLFTLAIFSSNAGTLSEMFGTIGTWLNNPATNPMAYGVPLNKGNLAILLSEGSALFVDYHRTLIEYLPLIAFKMFVFFFTLFILFIRGEDIWNKLFCHVPEPVQRYVTRLSDVTSDTLYTVYIVQIAIAVLTFFIALPVFYLLGYGNILFFSFFAAFCELIPILGSSVAFIIIGAYALALGDTRGVLLLFVLGYLGVSLVPEIYIRPALVGRRVKINFIIMFIGIVGGLMTMGLAGFVLGPLIVVLVITSYRIYTEDKKEQNAGTGTCDP